MKLIIAIVQRNKGELITSSAKKVGCGGATIILGRGTARNQILEILGLGSSDKDLVYMIAKESECPLFIDAIKETVKKEKRGFGILFTSDVSQIIKTGVIEKERKETKDMATHTLITVILNSGLAEDAMAVARKAGANGGTIINARGTGKAEDVSFFGITIVPEKEMVLILSKKGEEDKIISAIKDLPCLQERGSGIIYCSDVNHFTSLGQQK